MKAFMGIIWMLCGIGLTLHFASNNPMVQSAGHVLVVIALLWRLLLYLRETQPAAEHLHTIEQLKLSTLNLTAPCLPSESAPPLPAIAPRAQDGRTPVERLVNDDE